MTETKLPNPYNARQLLDSINRYKKEPIALEPFLKMIQHSHNLCKRHGLAFKPTADFFDFVIEELNMVVKIDVVGIIRTINGEYGDDEYKNFNPEEWVFKYFDHLDRILTEGREIQSTIEFWDTDNERTLLEEYQLMTWKVKDSKLPQD